MFGHQSFSCIYQDARASNQPCKKIILDQSPGIVHPPSNYISGSVSSTRLKLINMLKRSCRAVVAKGILQKGTSSKSCGKKFTHLLSHIYSPSLQKV